MAGLSREVDTTPGLFAGTRYDSECVFGGVYGSSAVLALGGGSGFSDVQGHGAATFLANQTGVRGFIRFKNVRNTLFLRT